MSTAQHGPTSRKEFYSERYEQDKMEEDKKDRAHLSRDCPKDGSVVCSIVPLGPPLLHIDRWPSSGLSVSGCNALTEHYCHQQLAQWQGARRSHGGHHGHSQGHKHQPLITVTRTLTRARLLAAPAAVARGSVNTTVIRTASLTNACTHKTRRPTPGPQLAMWGAERCTPSIENFSLARRATS